MSGVGPEHRGDPVITLVTPVSESHASIASSLPLLLSAVSSNPFGIHWTCGDPHDRELAAVMNSGSFTAHYSRNLSHSCYTMAALCLLGRSG